MPHKDPLEKNAYERERRARVRASKKLKKLTSPRDGAREEVVAKLVNKIISTVKDKARKRGYMTKFRAEHPDKVKARNATTLEKDKTSASSLGLTLREFREQRHDQRKPGLFCQTDWRRKRYNEDIEFQLRCKLSVRLADVMKKQLTSKTDSVLAYIGCTLSEFRTRMQERSETGALEDLDVDHIFPISKYDLSCEAEKAMHWSNLQMLGRSANAEKSDTLPTKAMAARVERDKWPAGVTEDMLPDLYSGWHSALQKHAPSGSTPEDA